MQAEGELPLQFRQAGRAARRVAGQDRLGVSVGLVRVVETPAQVAVVQDLAVEREVAGAIGRGHGLTGAGQVDDRQAPMAEADRPVAPVALGIRATMHEAGRHGAQQVGVDVAAVEPANSDDPAHGQQRSMKSRRAVISESLA